MNAHDVIITAPVVRPADGIQWCSTHHGVRWDDQPGHCDLFIKGADREPCEFHQLQYLAEVVDVVEVDQ